MIPATPPPVTAAQRASIDLIVKRVMHDNAIPGLSIGIARRGAQLIVRGYGMRDPQHRIAADGATVYRIGSLTKQFTAAMILQDVARGQLRLDERVFEVLPSLDGSPATVSVAQLLDQTSGLASYTDAPLPAIIDAAAKPSPLAAWGIVAATPQGFAPGTGWAYSNTNYLLLGMMLEARDGESYDALVHDRITGPLGLTATGAMPAAGDVATGSQAFGPYGQIAFAAGSLASNAPDLLAWLEALRSGRVVSQAQFSEMTSSATLADGTPTNYGYGFFVRNWYGYRVAEHNGFIDGFSAEDAIVLDDGLEVAILCNKQNVDLRPLAQTVVSIFDAPHDKNLVAIANAPPENENPAVAAALRSLLADLAAGRIDRALLAPSFARSFDDRAIAQYQARLAIFGGLSQLEFLERSRDGATTLDTYRAVFANGPMRIVAGYGSDGKIVSLTLQPDA